MDNCTEIEVEYICLTKGETLQEAIGTPDFDIQGATIVAQFRHEFSSGLVFEYTTEGVDPSVIINLDNTFTIKERLMNYPVGVYYGDWWFTLDGGDPFIYWRTQITIKNTYTKQNGI